MNDTNKFEELSALYPGAVEKRDAARRAAEVQKAIDWSGPPRWPLELAQRETALALDELAAEINHADPALKKLRALLVDELEKWARSFELAGVAPPVTPGPLNDPTPGAVLAKVEALHADDTFRARRSARVSTRITLVFRAVAEALGLLAAARLAQGLPSPSKPERFVDFELLGPSPTNPRDCAALIQQIKAKAQPRIPSDTTTEINELRARIRQHLAEQHDWVEAEARAARDSAERKAAEARADKLRHAAWLAEGEEQSAANAALQMPLTADEVAQVKAAL